MNFRKNVVRLMIEFVGVISRLIIFLGIFSAPILLKYLQFIGVAGSIDNSFIRFCIFALAAMAGIIIPLTGFLIYTIYEEMKRRRGFMRLTDRHQSKIKLIDAK